MQDSNENTPQLPPQPAPLSQVGRQDAQIFGNAFENTNLAGGEPDQNNPQTPMSSPSPSP